MLLWTRSECSFRTGKAAACPKLMFSQRKQAVSSQTSELEALEARLRATEERLKAAANAPARSPSGRSTGGGPNSPRQRVPLGDTFAQGRVEGERSPTSPLAQTFGNRPATANKPSSRPASGWKPDPSQAIPVALPPTPGASEGDYVIVHPERSSSTDYVVVDKDGDSPPPQAADPPSDES